MTASTIHVSHPDGSPCTGTKVVLGFSAGMTSPAFTNNRGEATVEHAATGKATVYVSCTNKNGVCGSDRADQLEVIQHVDMQNV